MRLEIVLTSLISLLISFFLIFLGVLFLLFPYHPHVAETLFRYLQNPLSARLLGGVFISLALLLWILFWQMLKRPYILVKMGGFSISLNVFKKVAENALKSMFPQQEVPISISSDRRGNLTIHARIPQVEEEKQEELLEEIERLLLEAFTSKLGYNREFIFNASFTSSQLSN